MAKNFMNLMKEKTTDLMPSVLSSEAHIKSQITILKKLRDLIPPLTKEEIGQLQQNILKHGVKDPLTIWETTSTIAEIDTLSRPVYVLIDGHNRFQICQQYKLDFRINIVRFNSLREVNDYMIDYQLGRRNLTAEQKSYLRGLRYLQQKSGRGGDKMGSQIDVSLALGKEYGVSSRTIKRDGDFAMGLEKLEPELRNELLTGKKKLSKSAITAIAKTNTVEPINSVEKIIETHSVQKESLLSNKSQIELTQLELRELVKGSLDEEGCQAIINKANELLTLFGSK
ncbi:MAG: hypothetical protein QM669_15345 [Siphonobacter sp.]